MLRRLFLDHPRSVGESYVEHMRVAGGFGWAMLRASAACFAHALIPGLFVTTASGIIRDLHSRMVTNRRKHAEPEPEGDDALIWLAANI